jgi:hypothetical protein
VDFDLNDSQRERLRVVGQLIDDAGGADAEPAQMDSHLAQSGIGDSASVLDRFLIAEELAYRGTASAYGTRTLLDELLPAWVPPAAVALAEAGRRGPVRFADSASAVVILDGDAARLFREEECGVTPANTIFGYRYAHISPSAPGRLLPDGLGEAVRRRWRLALVAEISGNARSAIACAATHLTSRVQFGRPLSSFQALRHRLADAAVSAEATRWLGREAAFHDDTQRCTRAAWYASQTAATLVPELVQMCGARSFTLAFGLHKFTMRMNCLRLELGGIDRLGAELSGESVEASSRALVAQ